MEPIYRSSISDIPQEIYLDDDNNDWLSCITTSKIVQFVGNFLSFGISFTQDACLLPFAGALTAASMLGYNFNPDPKDIIKGKTPILLVHGAGFNESEWFLPRCYLSTLQSVDYGSVFSLNLDGYISNEPTKGIEDYSQKISDFINDYVSPQTDCKKVILMGHSLGGLVAMNYAEKLAKKSDIDVKHVFTFSTPLHGTPTIDLVWKFANVRKTKHHEQMSLNGGKLENRSVRIELVNQALKSQKEGQRNYYSIWSTTDWAVPENQGRLSDRSVDESRQFKVDYRGHYYPAYSMPLWRWVCKHLDHIYKEEG